MSKIKITFENDYIFYAELDQAKANKTVEILLESLPLECQFFQSRWSGREINTNINIDEFPPKENQSIYVSIGDICYWRDWREEVEKNINHVLAIYYGPEMARSHVGNEPVNIIGKIDHKGLEEIIKLGEIVWKEGMKRAKIELAKHT